jgi:predicted DNA-binding transcriptional regulator AlpA
MNSTTKKNEALTEDDDLEPLDEEQRYVTAKYIARRFGISLSSVWKWNAAGKLPKSVRFSSQITRWRVSDLDAWENERCER